MQVMASRITIQGKNLINKGGCFWGQAILKFALCLKMRGNAFFWKFMGRVKLHLLPITCTLTVQNLTSEFVLRHQSLLGIFGCCSSLGLGWTLESFFFFFGMRFQSCFSLYPSKEVLNDLFMNAVASILISLDLSMAFDTVNRAIISECLREFPSLNTQFYIKITLEKHSFVGKYFS